MWVKITKDHSLPSNSEEYESLEYVQSSLTRYEDRFLPIDGARPEEDIEEKSKLKYEVDDSGFLPQYRIALINTSKRVIPKSLVFVGNFKRWRDGKLLLLYLQCPGRCDRDS